MSSIYYKKWLFQSIISLIYYNPMQKLFILLWYPAASSLFELLFSQMLMLLKWFEYFLWGKLMYFVFIFSLNLTSQYKKNSDRDVKYSIRGKTLPLEFHPITQHGDDVVLERELVWIEKSIIYVNKTLTSLKHSFPICKLLIIISLYTFGNYIVYIRKAIQFRWSVSRSKHLCHVAHSTWIVQAFLYSIPVLISAWCGKQPPSLFKLQC